MKKLLVMLVLILAAAVVVDIGAKRFVENRLASELESSSATAREIDVELSGFPFLPGAVSGDIPEMRVTVRGLRSGGVRIERLDVTLEDLRFDLTTVLVEGLDQARARRARGTVTVPESELDALLADQGAPIEVDLEGDRAVADGRAVEASVRGTALVLHAPEPVGEIEVGLPTPLAELSYERLEIAGSSLVLYFNIRNPDLTLT